MQDDHGSHFRAQTDEAAFELVAVRDRRLEAGDRRQRAADVNEFYVDTMAPQPARLIDAGADDQAVEPCVEGVRVA